MSPCSFTFIDLFAGVGGFHQAMEAQGGKCVLASEINKDCQKTYRLNFPETKLKGNINKLNIKKIDKFDVLCAGFPCQSFSKAGKRKGFSDKTRGPLFDKIVDILGAHAECQFFILENVRNLADHGENWKYVQDQLATLNYYVTKEPLILNPTQFGIPQKRERVYILGIRKDICDTSKLADGQIEISHLGIDKHFKECGAKEAFTFIKPYTKEKELVPLEPEKAAILEAWSFFKDNFLQEPLHAPVWIPYFGVGYGPEKTEELYTKWGFYKKKPTPLWKQRIIKANREFYLSKQKDLDKWMECYGLTGKSKILNKFEWNCQKDCKSLKDGVIQIRQSGVRVKRPNYYPSLVAMDNTPIIWDEKHQYYRYLSVREAACLQSFNDDFKFAGTISEQHRELGNSVNVQILKYVAEGLFALQTNGGFKK